MDFGGRIIWWVSRGPSSPRDCGLGTYCALEPSVRLRLLEIFDRNCRNVNIPHLASEGAVAQTHRGLELVGDAAVVLHTAKASIGMEAGLKVHAVHTCCRACGRTYSSCVQNTLRLRSSAATCQLTTGSALRCVTTAGLAHGSTKQRLLRLRQAQISQGACSKNLQCRRALSGSEAFRASQRTLNPRFSPPAGPCCAPPRPACPGHPAAMAGMSLDGCGPVNLDSSWQSTLP